MHHTIFQNDCITFIYSTFVCIITHFKKPYASLQYFQTFTHSNFLYDGFLSISLSWVSFPPLSRFLIHFPHTLFLQMNLFPLTSILCTLHHLHITSSPPHLTMSSIPTDIEKLILQAKALSQSDLNLEPEAITVTHFSNVTLVWSLSPLTPWISMPSMQPLKLFGAL